MWLQIIPSTYVLFAEQHTSAKDGDACAKTPLKKQQAAKVPGIDPSGHPGSQLCVELFSNSPHWSLQVSTRHNRHPMTQGGSGGVQEVQLAAPRSTGWVTDNQHGGGERKELGGGKET